ncbi:MAG: TlpA family protein disulfide reductase [Nitrosomonadales bacterium]|nr:TlpA family protein disulfide reductase [Nitrosomonadales bacterium]
MKTLRIALAASLAMISLCAIADEFKFKDTQGHQQRLSDYRGKWVLVNFWATWCPPCQKEIPDLIALHDAHKDKDLVVIGIAMEYASSKVVTDFATKHGITYPIVLGTYKLAAQIGSTTSLPETYLYDPAGKLTGHQSGAITRESVEEYINEKSRK